MYIAFRCYDVDDDQNISEDEVKVVLKNIPLQHIERLEETICANGFTRVEHMNQKRTDNEQITRFVDTIFSEHPNGMYFDEFTKLAQECTSELFISIYDSIYQCIPCVKNFLIMRANYKNLLKTRENIYVAPTFTVLMPPSTTKGLEKITEYIDTSPQKKKEKYFKRESLMKSKLVSHQNISGYASFSVEKTSSDSPTSPEKSP